MQLLESQLYFLFIKVITGMSEIQSPQIRQQKYINVNFMILKDSTVATEENVLGCKKHTLKYLGVMRYKTGNSLKLFQ